jgi:hypothetical protein
VLVHIPRSFHLLNLNSSLKSIHNHKCSLLTTSLNTAIFPSSLFFPKSVLLPSSLCFLGIPCILTPPFPLCLLDSYISLIEKCLLSDEIAMFPRLSNTLYGPKNLGLNFFDQLPYCFNSNSFIDNNTMSLFLISSLFYPCHSTSFASLKPFSYSLLLFFLFLIFLISPQLFFPTPLLLEFLHMSSSTHFMVKNSSVVSTSIFSSTGLSNLTVNGVNGCLSYTT